MNRRRFVYLVWYGSCTSKFTAPTWAEACAFMKHCVDNGTPVTSVQKVAK